MYPTDKAHLKIASSTKEQLKTAQAHLEERLRDEQKMIRSQKRLVKVQELMSSEEEKKKYRHKMVCRTIFLNSRKDFVFKNVCVKKFVHMYYERLNTAPYFSSNQFEIF